MLFRSYVRPDVDLSGEIRITDGRHPVVETLCKDTVFVPNDTTLDEHDNRLAIITGPNMAGKSTYMRQVALIVILAHIGSFVPAASAKIGLVDQIFTRIGASDELAAGKSTFMVEMSETAAILKAATKHSLLIFDEIIGACNTGVFDQAALVEFLKNKPQELEVVMTGRNPAPELVELADYVSEVCMRKHPFKRGIPARVGIEK